MKTTTRPGDLISQPYDRHTMHCGSAVTMSSREIAELTGKRHDNVALICRQLIETGGCPEIQETPCRHPQNGQTYTEYRLCKRDSLVLVARLSPEFTADIVDRWMALEAHQAQRIPQTYGEALRLAADQHDQIQAQQRQIHEKDQELTVARPKAEFVDRYVEGTGLKSFRQVCKILSAKENRFRAFLKDKRVMYRMGKEWVPFAEHVNAGRLSMKTDQARNGHTYCAARFTPKGVTWVSHLWDEHLREVAE